METVTNFNQLALKALLLDTISYLKFKRHLPGYNPHVKEGFCKAKGISSKVQPFTLLKHIGKVYEENGLKDDFFSTCERMGYPLNEV